MRSLAAFFFGLFMKKILILLILLPIYSYAANCPTGSTYLGIYIESPGSSPFNLALYTTDLATKIITNVQLSEQAVNNGVPYTKVYNNVCKMPTPVTCTSGNVLEAGKFGVNYGCKPPPCPATHPTPSDSGKACKDSNGCNQDQSFINGICVNKKIEDITARCMAAAGQTQVATITVPSDGSGPTCSVGGPVNIGTVPECTTAPGGSACVISPLAAGDKTGFQCGSFNGAQVCVASSETNAIGTSSKTPGTSTQSGTPKTIEEQVSENGETVRTIKTTTPQTTSTTSVNDSSPLGEGQQMDGGAGSAPMPPYTCSNGMPAANLQSCDTSTTCPEGSYIAYGVCIKMPTRTSVAAKDVTQTTITRTNDSTGQTVSQTSSTSSVSTPVKNPSAPGTVDSQRSGQCDPTAKNYQECLGMLVQVPDTLQTQTKTANDSAFSQLITDKDNAEKSAIASTNASQLNANTNGVKAILNPVVSFFSAPACVPLSFTIATRTFTISCDISVKIKSVLAFIFYIYTLIHLYQLFFRSNP